jgi:hypothetical protein
LFFRLRGSSLQINSLSGCRQVSRPHVEFRLLQAEPCEPYYFGSLASGARAQLLSHDRSDGAHTALVAAAPLWSWPNPGYFANDLEVLVLSGTVQLGPHALSAGWYLHLAAGEYLESIESEAGCRMLWMSAANSSFVESSSSGPMYEASRTIAPIDARGSAWAEPPDFEGRSVAETIPGLSVKWLREDPQSTAYTLLSRHAPGWADPRLEAHDTWEELILLDGDYLMGDTGGVTAGTYIFRPGQRPHGPQATRDGAVWFCRGERRIDFDLQSPERAAQRVSQYARSAMGPAPQTPPWGNWL